MRKGNVWTWRGKNRILKSDPRERLSLGEKVKLMNEKIETARNERK